MQEEQASYQDKAGDRYNRKPHFDLLSHAVAHSIEFLNTVRDVIREDAPEAEAAWFGPLEKISLRIGETLNHVLPIFEAEEEAETNA